MAKTMLLGEVENVSIDIANTVNLFRDCEQLTEVETGGNDLGILGKGYTWQLINLFVVY